MPVISERNATGSNSDQVGDRRGVTFADQVPAGATNRTLTYTIPRDATVERVQVRIYDGAQLDLELSPYISQGADEGRTDVIRTVGKDYIDGDDDVYEWDVSLPVERGDELVWSATNNDGSNAYDYRAIVDVEHGGGLRRLVGGVL